VEGKEEIWAYYNLSHRESFSASQKFFQKTVFSESPALIPAGRMVIFHKKSGNSSQMYRHIELFYKQKPFLEESKDHRDAPGEQGRAHGQTVQASEPGASVRGLPVMPPGHIRV
jgi:hypothetical protein